MKFFELAHSVNPQIIGNEYPQIQKMYYDETQNYLHPNYFKNFDFFGYHSFDFDPIFDTFLLKNKAKFTDLISNVYFSRPFTISAKSLDIFQNHLIDNSKSHLIKVKKGNKIFDYYCFYIFGNSWESLSLENTLFYAEKDEPETDVPRRYVKIDNIEQVNDWAKWNSRYPNLEIEEAIYKKSLKKSDLFIGTGSSYFVSEKLKNSLLENGVTGFDFEEVHLKFEDMVR